MAGDEFLVRIVLAVRVQDRDALLAAYAAARAERGGGEPASPQVPNALYEDALQELIALPAIADVPGCAWATTTEPGDQGTWSASIAVEPVPQT